VSDYRGTFAISEGETVTYEGGVARFGDKIVRVGGGKAVGRCGRAEAGKRCCGSRHRASRLHGGRRYAREDGTVVASCRGW
jgi:hypothetical protein